MNLNKASLLAWSELQKDKSAADISQRLIELSYQDKLTKQEQKEFNRLIKIEKAILSEAEARALKGQRLTKRFFSYFDLIKEERLQCLFDFKVNQGFDRDEIHTEEHIDEIYHSLMREDIEIKGHLELNELYNTLKEEKAENEEIEEDEGRIAGEDYYYCPDITDIEYTESFNILLGDGFFDKSIPMVNRMVDLMTTIIRLEKFIKETLPDELGDDTDDEFGDINDIDDLN